MKIERVSLLSNALGLIGVGFAMSAGMVAAYIINDHITVLKRSDGTYGFKNHKGEKLNAAQQEEIVSEIEK